MLGYWAQFEFFSETKKWDFIHSFSKLFLFEQLIICRCFARCCERAVCSALGSSLTAGCKDNGMKTIQHHSESCDGLFDRVNFINSYI